VRDFQDFLYIKGVDICEWKDKNKIGGTGMSGEIGEKSGRWVMLIPFLIWAVSLVGFSFSPSGFHIPYSSHGDEFSLNIP